MTERFRQGATEFPRSFRVLRPYSGLHQDGIGNPDLLPVKSTIPRTTIPTGWAAYPPRSMKKLLAIGLLSLIAVITGLLWWSGQQHKVSRFLPPEATNIDESFFGSVDFAKYMRAKVSEDGFHIFRKRIGYAKDDLILSDPDNYFGWSSADKVGEWWDPTPETLGSYGKYDEENGSLGMLKYENGYVYHMYQKW